MAAPSSDAPLWKRSRFTTMLHSPRLRWRTAFTYTSVIALILLGLANYLAMRFSLPLRQIGWPIAVAGFFITALMVFQAERAAATIRRLTGVAERITQGELDARIISLSSGEIGQLARTFNRMADKLQKQIEKRAREKERLHSVLHALTDGVLIFNRHGEVRLLNPAAERLLHTEAEWALDRTIVQVVRDHRIVEVYNRAIKSEHEEVDMLEMDHGRVLRVAVSPFLKGSRRGHVLILQDLTRLHQLQTVRHDFITNISHELRTPLASLRALVETLADGAIDDPPAAQRFLQRMEVEVDALTQMVQELLELSRIEAGQAALRLQELPVAAVIGLGAERLRPQAERSNLALHFDLPEPLPEIVVDPDRIQQVVTNLVHNAIKFTPAGGCITLSALPNAAAGEVVISVHDTGVGIASEDLPRIFERFYKADRARAGGGTGLGLAIAKHIVQAHGGRIWAESAVGKGSTFFFTLPSAPSTPANPAGVVPSLAA
jgi:two-component system, OmpR family, phosphate regulon sensor histidine kinase PhoR